MILKSPFRRTCLGLTMFSLLLTAAFCKSASSAAQREGASQASQSKFRLTRSISGSKGHEQGGRYALDDPRTVFKVPDDRQVLVYCEWEGATGVARQHEFEGQWKNPAGKLVAVSDFKLEVRERRCSGFFTLLLSETSETGTWTLEARVDGEMTGTHKFQVASANEPAAQTATGPAQTNPANQTNSANSANPANSTPPEQARQFLNESQIYELANAATVLVEKLDSKGVRVDTGSGFFVEPDVMLTAFQVIDGATRLRVLLPDGRRLETQEALSWDKWQDWAFVKVETGEKQAGEKQAGRLRSQFIALSPNADSSVGSRVYALAVSPAGTRVIVRCDIVGKNKFPQNSERLNLNCTHPDVIGSPLLNEYGDLVGVVGGLLIPGWASTKSLQGVYFSGAAIANATPGLLAVPVNSSSKPSSMQAATNFEQLASNGVFTPPLTGFENIQYGTLAKRVETKPGPRPMEETYEFRSKDGAFAVFLSWQPKEKIKASAMIRVYDLAGRALIESKPTNLNLKPGKDSAYSWWKADISSLKPAVYRVDVLLDSRPLWRAFFRVRE